MKISPKLEKSFAVIVVGAKAFMGRDSSKLIYSLTWMGNSQRLVSLIIDKALNGPI